jgi:hypothetical protein
VTPVKFQVVELVSNLIGLRKEIIRSGKGTQREKVIKKKAPTEKMTGTLAMEYCGCILLFHKKII